VAGRLTRFLNLEKARKPGETPAHGVVNKVRFGEEPPAPADPDELFRAERAARLESGVEIATAGAADQPFLRCPLCEADNTKYAVKCINCQAALDTDQVRDWNAALWQKRRAQQQVEASGAAANERLREQNRLLGEALAREVAERERGRLGWGASYGDSTPLGIRLLNLIEDPNLRFVAGLLMAGGFIASGLIAFTARHHPGVQTAAFVVAVALLILFTPNRPRRRRWWDWD
jgi:hypothetical protein